METDMEKRLLRAVEALVQIEMTSLGLAKAQAGKSDAELLQVIADTAREARWAIMGEPFLDVRQLGGVLNSQAQQKGGN